MSNLKAKAKTTAEVLLLAVIAAFLAAMCVGVFVDLFWGTNSKPTESFRGAFLGALFAFIFVRLGEGLNRLYDAAKESRKALATIQFNLNETLGICNDNRFVLEQWDRFYQVLKSAKGTVPIFTNRVEPVPSSKEILIRLGSIGLVNELFLLESTIRKLNDSMETWQRSYELAKDNFIATRINLETYVANVERGNEGAILLTKFVDGLVEEIMSALAATRLLLRDKPFLAKLYAWVHPDRYSQPNDPDRAAELVKLHKEVLEISKASRARIQALTTGSQDVTRET